MKLIQVGADWCGPCVQAKQIVPSITLDLGIGFEYRDMGSHKDFTSNMDKLKDEFPEAESFKQIPFFILVDNDGKVLYTKLGYSTAMFREIKQIGQ